MQNNIMSTKYFCAIYIHTKRMIGMEMKIISI